MLMVEFTKYIVTKNEGAYRLLPTVYVCLWEVYTPGFDPLLLL